MANKRPYQKADQGGYSALQKYWKKYGWKKSEITYLKNNYNKKTDLEMSNGFLKRRTPAAIESKRRELNLKKSQPAPRIWSKEEKKILIENYKNNTRFELANTLLPNKAPSQIRDKVHKLRLTKSKWTDEELDKLIKVAGRIDAALIVAYHLPNKTASQVRDKVKRLGIRRRKIKSQQVARRDRMNYLLSKLNKKLKNER